MKKIFAKNTEASSIRPLLKKTVIKWITSKDPSFPQDYPPPSETGLLPALETRTHFPRHNIHCPQDHH